MLRAPAHGALLHGVLLHGRLDAEVLRAEQLWEPGARSARERFVRVLASGSGLNPYATMRLEQLPRYKRILKTAAIPNSDAPVWNHRCSIDVATNVSYIVVHVKTAAPPDQSARLCPHKSLGFVRIKAEKVLLNVVDGWFPLSGYQGIRDHDGKNRGRILIKLIYHRVEEIMSPLRGRLPTVPGTYFHPVERCHMQLFQDAHCPHGAVLDIPGSSDYLYDSSVVQSSSSGKSNANGACICMFTTNQTENMDSSPVSDAESCTCETHGIAKNYDVRQIIDAETYCCAASPSYRQTDEDETPAESNGISHAGRLTISSTYQKRESIQPARSPPLSRLPSARIERPISPSNSVPFPRMSNYFEEIYRAIFNARKLIYITGWSVDTTMRLLREPRPSQPFTSSEEDVTAPERCDNQTPNTSLDNILPNLTLGELLKLKADQGVRVLLLVWDEVFSSNHPLLRWKGLMNTKDEITREFFRNSKVKAAVVPRIGRAGRVLKAPIVPCMFTFHEKLIITDVPLRTPHHLSQEEDEAINVEEELDQPRAQGHSFMSQSLKSRLASHLPNLSNLSNLPYLHAGSGTGHGQSHHSRSHSLGGYLHNPLHQNPQNSAATSSSSPNSPQATSSTQAGAKHGPDAHADTLEPGEAGPGSVRFAPKGAEASSSVKPSIGRPPVIPTGDRNLFSSSSIRGRQQAYLRSSDQQARKGSSSSGLLRLATGSQASSRSVFASRRIVTDDSQERSEKKTEASETITGPSSAYADSEPVSEFGQEVFNDMAEGDAENHPSRSQHLSFSGSHPSFRSMLTSRMPMIPSYKHLAPQPCELADNEGRTVGELTGDKAMRCGIACKSTSTASLAPPASSRVPPIGTEMDDAAPNSRNTGAAVANGTGSPAAHIARPPPRDPNSRGPGANALNAMMMAGSKGISNFTPRPTPGMRTGEARQLSAFIGGLDLTYGRFDTPDHSLFRTLETLHKDDFHNACSAVGSTFGPREPWHDVAANVTGPIVRDLASCFEERWRRQGRGVSHLVDLANDAEIHDGPFAHEDEQWTVQIFRSIDERSAIFTRETERLLETKKGRRVDRSIHHAYVHYTRAAKRYIYIEQQYFIGSSNQWLTDNHGEATNLIPYELALKIANSIAAGDPLRVYIVIPMFPEGIPSELSIQQILFFQFKTIEMMYKKVADAISAAKLADAHPTDYLNFFCLGNREVNGPKPVHTDLAISPVTPLEQDEQLPLPPNPPPERPLLPHNRLLSKPRWFGSRRNSYTTAASVTESDTDSVQVQENGVCVPASSGDHGYSTSSSDGAEAAALAAVARESRGSRKIKKSSRTNSSTAASATSSRSSAKPPRALTNSFAWSASDSGRESRKQRYPRAGDEETLQKTRRHPIYQHAKLFLSDDEIIMTGSSNLNERSMAGVRDTEMVIGAFQPSHIYPIASANDRACSNGETGVQLPQGEVARFRKRLWAEHALGPQTSTFPEELEDPGSLRCVRMLQQIAKTNWEAYIGETVVELQSHLMTYPYKIEQNGDVSALVRCFPDTKAPVIGSFSNIIPNILTS